MPRTELTDEQWSKIEPLLPPPRKNPKGGPTPKPNRPCLEGILWVLRSGASWQHLPRNEGYPSYSTCRRRLIEWEEAGVWLTVWHKFLDELNERGWLQWEECFADGTFSPAKKGANASVKPAGERVRSLWWWQTARAFLWRSERSRPTRRR